MSMLERLGAQEPKAQATWRLGMEDGDHLVDARVVGNDKLQINVDGMQAIKVKMENEKTFPFRVGTHLANMTVERKWNLIMIAAGVWAAFIMIAALGEGGSKAICPALIFAGVPLWLASLTLGREFKLVIDGREVPQGIRTVIAEKVVHTASPAYQPQEIHIYQDAAHSAQPAAPSAPAPPPVVPALPARCESCGQPLSMDNVQWSGPLNARCPACGAAVEVTWKALGASGR